MSPRPRVAPRRRREIVEALARLMGRRGYGEIGFTQIAAEAGVARGAINFFFRGKDEILRALLDRAIADYQAALRPILAAAGPADVQVRAALACLLAPTRATRTTMLVFLNYYALAPGRPALAPRLRDFFREYRRFFALLLRRGIRQGCFPRGLDPDEVAALMVAAVEGLLLQWVMQPKAVDPRKAIAALERLLAAPGGADAGPRKPRRTSDGA